MPSSLASISSILVAEDDADDRMMIKDALRENLLADDLSFVSDGEELMDYLLHCGKFEDGEHPLPDLIFLDLNMPKKDGREALAEIKNHPMLKSIPVVVLTTSKFEDNLCRTYNLDKHSFFTKPTAFEELVAMTRNIGQHWLKNNLAPSPSGSFA